MIVVTRTPTSGVVRAIGFGGACALAIACTKGDSGDGGVFASAGTITTASGGEGSESTAGADDEGEGEEGTSAGSGATEGAGSDGESGASGVTSADATSADATSASDSIGDGSSDGGEGGGGPACSGSGEMSFAGASGAAMANQNCPQTDYPVQVAGAPGPITDVDVSLEAIAASTDQNRIWLVSPSNVQVLLFDHGGTFLTDDFVGTIFDDQAATPVATAPGPFHGCFRPEQGLAAFNNASADGQWILRVETCLYETSVTSWELHLDF
jgi:hypothetical protein